MTKAAKPPATPSVAPGKPRRGDPDAASERLFRQLSDASPVGVFRTDLAGRCTYTNPRWQALTGLTFEQSLGEGWTAALHPDDRDKVLSMWRRSVDARGDVAFEFRFVTPRGKVNWVIARAAPMRGTNGEIVGFLGTNEDITERKLAEEALRAKSENLQILLDVAQDVGGTLDTATLLGRLHQRLAALLPCDVAVTFYRAPDSDRFRVIHQYGLPGDRRTARLARAFIPDETLLDGISSSQPTVINDVARKEGLPTEFLARFHVSALVVVPLRAGGRTIGSLVVARTHAAAPFDAAHTALLQALAPYVAAALNAAEAHHRQQQQARVSAALARVGQELISAVDTRTLLERLCRLTASVLGSDFSHTFLFDENDAVFTPVAGYGDTPEQWQSLQPLRIPRAGIDRLIRRLEQYDIAQVVVSEPQDLVPAEFPSRYGITASLYLALRRQDRLFGVLTAGYRGRTRRFGAEKERIARGLAHIAALALANARLVEELEQANRVKSDFVAAMSHELRNPLNVILGYNDLLLDGEFGPLNEEQADKLRIMHRNAVDLVDLVNATLDLSRLDSRRVPLDVRRFALRDLFDELRREVETRPKPCVTTTWEIAPEPKTLRSDRVKVKMVLMNLIDNAIKFTDRGEIAVTARPRDAGVEVAVRDTGIGIAADQLELIFEPFRQLDTSITRRHGGAGLGLYLVRRLLDALGGTIAVQSAPGQGSTFRVWLPAEPRAAKPAAPAARDNA